MSKCPSVHVTRNSCFLSFFLLCNSPPLHPLFACIPLFSSLVIITLCSLFHPYCSLPLFLLLGPIIHSMSNVSVVNSGKVRIDCPVSGLLIQQIKWTKGTLKTYNHSVTLFSSAVVFQFSPPLQLYILCPNSQRLSFSFGQCGFSSLPFFSILGFSKAACISSYIGRRKSNCSC